MGTWKRRGLLAGLAGVVAGTLAQESERPAEAGHNANVGANPLHLGLNNTNDTNTITTVTAGVANGFAFRVDNNGTNGSAITGEASGIGIGIRGSSPSGVAVQGTAQGTGTGVSGGTSNGVGVFGLASGTGNGVRGTANTGVGVDAGSSFGVGIRGQVGSNTVDTVTKIGVDGLSQQAGGIGVRGEGGGTGVLGDSPNTGVAGTSSGGLAVFGTTNTGTAGLFVGPVLVQGDFTVTGAKSAAVPLPGGGLGRTYAMECPDSWLADFGEGQLTDGFRRVPIDPTFAATVDLSGRYHVVITPLADTILYVTNRTPESFDVRTSSLWTGDRIDRDERRGPPPEPIRFTWWVIGRRKDIKGPRFEEVKVPSPPKLP